MEEKEGLEKKREKSVGTTARLHAAEQESGLGGKQWGSMPGGGVCLLLFPVTFSG